MNYTRAIYPKLEAELTTKEALVITGMRRVGKTTALQHLFSLIPSSNKAMFDLENPLHRKLFESANYDAIWHNLNQFQITNKEKAFIFIDEAQYLPEISRVIKYFYDHWNVKWILTGSSSYYLRNLFPESLAGRKILFELFPLTFGEFLTFKEILREFLPSFSQKATKKNATRYEMLKPYFEEYMQFGGFPSVVLEPNQERKKLLLTEIFTSYFEKDAKNLADFSDMSKLRDLILLLVSRIGSKVEIAKLANTLGVTRQTIYGYLSFLEQTYFISLLPKYSKNSDRKAAGSKKLFFADTGIANMLGSISQGQLLEQSVFQTIRTKHALQYFSGKQGQEIDFIIDKNIGLEVKTTMSNRDVATLQNRCHTIHIPESYIVTQTYTSSPSAIIATDL